jgi:hypothetical protein
MTVLLEVAVRSVWSLASAEKKSGARSQMTY